jgi:hypothetical protein
LYPQPRIPVNLMRKISKLKFKVLYEVKQKTNLHQGFHQQIHL